MITIEGKEGVAAAVVKEVSAMTDRTLETRNRIKDRLFHNISFKVEMIAGE